MSRAPVTVSAGLLTLLACASASYAQSPVEVRTSLSRTAVWLGDRTIYSVELRCAPQVDVLLDDLAGGRVRVDGGEIVGVEENHENSGAGPIRRFRYTIVTYRVDVAELHIAAIPVRYYVRRAGGVQGSPAGQVSVPPAIVAIRSAIPEGEGVPPIRLFAALWSALCFAVIAQLVGILLIALAIVPLALLSVDLAGRGRRAWERYQALRSRRRGVSLDDLRATTPGSDSERIQAFERLDSLVREHLSLTTGIPARALTPAEIRVALEERAPSLPHSDIETLLAACERARYAAEPPAAEAWPDALREAEQILGVPQQ